MIIPCSQNKLRTPILAVDALRLLPGWRKCHDQMGRIGSGAMLPGCLRLGLQMMKMTVDYGRLSFSCRNYLWQDLAMFGTWTWDMFFEYPGRGVVSPNVLRERN